MINYPFEQKQLTFDQMMELIISSKSKKKPLKSKSLGYTLIALGVIVCCAIAIAVTCFAIETNLHGNFLMRFLGLILLVFPTYLLLMPGLKLIKKEGFTTNKRKWLCALSTLF